MKLLTKFNLILVALFGAGSILIAYTAYQFLMRNARSQVIQQAELMIESARSMRQYTANELAPLLETLPAHKTRFLPETIPFYAATVTFDYLRKEYPEYSYKEAALNPSNLRDRAVDWEADLIGYFRNHAGEKELVGERDTPTGRMLYIARPIATEQACLECHSQPAEAPPAIVQTYGSVNGFGWKANETVAAQIVSVPMDSLRTGRIRWERAAPHAPAREAIITFDGLISRIKGSRRQACAAVRLFFGGLIAWIATSGRRRGPNHHAGTSLIPSARVT
jgi:hypothetical protein